MRHSLFILGSLVSSLSFANTYTLDKAHSNIGFRVRHLMISYVNGNFTDFSGSFDLDNKNQLTHLKATINVSSIDTKEPKRDEHLKSPEFFDAQKFSTMEFVGEKVTYTKNQVTKIIGKLTMRGVTKPVTLNVEQSGPVKDPQGNDRIGFVAKTTVHREDFGLSYNKVLEAGGVAIGKDVEITIDGEAMSAKPAEVVPTGTKK